MTFEKKVPPSTPPRWTLPVAADREILLNNIRSLLLSLEVIRGWEKNPDNYSSGITNSAFVIMERPYASADTRLRALVEREKLMPQALEEARKNLKNPPDLHPDCAGTDRRRRQLLSERCAQRISEPVPDAATDAATKRRISPNRMQR
jgi:hypothetical protein